MKEEAVDWFLWVSILPVLIDLYFFLLKVEMVINVKEIKEGFDS